MTETPLPVESTVTAPRLWRRWLDSSELQFWTVQWVGWAAWAFASGIGWIYSMDKPDRPHVVLLYTWAASVGIAVTSVLRYVYRALWTRPLTLRITVAVLLSYLMGGVWQAAKNIAVLELLDEFEPMGWLGYFEGIQVSFYVMLLWSGLYFCIKYYRMLQRETEKVLRITAMAHQAQLKMLRYQLNPHFLFNTLNAISTLILERDTEHANQMVTALSRFLRYSLDNDPMQRVSLDQELTALHLYLDIEQARFDERLAVTSDIETLARRALLPSLLLQPIVENAIKYAIAPRESGGTIRIVAHVRGARLHVAITDDGPGIADVGLLNGSNGNAHAGRGVGLVNTRQRLAELYPRDHSFSMTNVAPRGLEVSLQIPFETT
jgi:signal transduction histidine kinase